MENTQKIISEKKELGASMVEYALIAALIAIVCIAGVTVLGQNASSKFSAIGSGINAN
jgi:pilus assembly protein Flp/PilA